MARHGILAKACEMTYTADKLAAYCDDYTKVNKDVMADIYKEIKETITKETEDATYRMLYVATGNTDYLYHLNEEMYLMSILMRRISLRLWQQDRKRIIILSFRHRLL